MPQLDWLGAVGLILGGSGVTGWILTYLQLRQQRMLEARHIFRDVVLTREMLELLASDFDLIELQEATMEFD